MKKLIHVVLTMVAASSCLSVMAENAYYASFDIGRNDWRDAGETVTEPTIAVGYQINDNFSVELGFQDFGELKYGKDDAMHVEADAIQVSLIGGGLVSDTIGLFAQVGLDIWNLSHTEEVYVIDQNDLFYGAGAFYRASENLNINLKFQFHELDWGAGSDGDSHEVNTISLGGKYTF